MSSELTKRERKAKKTQIFYYKFTAENLNKWRKEVKGLEMELPRRACKFVQNEIQTGIYINHNVSPLLSTFDLLGSHKCQKISLILPKLHVDMI